MLFTQTTFSTELLLKFHCTYIPFNSFIAHVILLQTGVTFFGTE